MSATILRALASILNRQSPKMRTTTMELDHINISTPMALMETVKDFYCDALGFCVGLTG